MDTYETCTRCKRTRAVKFLSQKKNYSGKRVWRCTARSVCASKARRLRQKLDNRKVA